MLSFFFFFFSLFLLCTSSKFNWLKIKFFLGLSFLYFLFMIYNPMLSFSYVSKIFYLDSMSSLLVLLSIWISCLMYMSSQSIYLKGLYVSRFLFFVCLLCIILVFSFSISSMLGFYLFFEMSLIPTLILVLGWGYQPERLQAGVYLMMYTISASLPLLISLMYIYSSCGSLYMGFSYLFMFKYLNYIGFWWLISIMAFMVKMPLYLFHLWLPKAHVEAPVSGSMVLAAILLKLGGYGMLRLSQMFCWGNGFLLSLFVSISMWGACMTSFICMRQNDIKSLIAYSSVGHMGLLISGLMINQVWGWYGCLVMMISHGLVSSGLFCMGNMTYENTSSRSLYMTKGLLCLLPSMSMFWFILGVMNMAAPPSINLLGEIMLLSGILSLGIFMVPLIAVCSFMAACYSLYMYTCIHHGQSGFLFNSLVSGSSRNMSIIFFHCFPVFMLISCSQYISIWV